MPDTSTKIKIEVRENAVSGDLFDMHLFCKIILCAVNTIRESLGLRRCQHLCEAKNSTLSHVSVPEIHGKQQKKHPVLSSALVIPSEMGITSYTEK